MIKRKLEKSFVLAIAAGLVYSVLSVSSALTKSPWSDEAWFANAAWNLATKGRMVTTVLETSGTNLQGLDQYTFWVMPLHLLVQAGWYKVFGFSLLGMRLISVGFGFLALVAWYVVIKSLSESRQVALLTVALLSVDYVFVMGASLGRMDMMSSALGASGLAVYLLLREQSLTKAIFFSQSLVVASGLTHPNGGLLFFFGVLSIAVLFDRTRLLRPWKLATFCLPYVIGSLLWGAYIIRAPSLFVAQFTTNASMGGRLSGLTSPLTALQNEITLRYLQSFGLAGHSLGHEGPIKLKALILATYIVAISGVLITRKLRQQAGIRRLLLLTLLFFLLLAIFDGQKLSFYLIHIIPLYTALLAVWIRWCWTSRPFPRWVPILILTGFISLQAGGILYRAYLDSYHNSYLPAVNFIKGNFDDNTRVMGSAVLGFGIGFDRIIDDVRLGFLTGRRPKLIVVGETYDGAFKDYEKKEPLIYQHILRLTTKEYSQVYNYKTFQIYERISLEE